MSRSLLVAFVLFTLWDVYYAKLGGRILDYGGLGVALIGVLTGLVRSKGLVQPSAFKSTGYLLLILPYLIPALFNGYYLTATAYLIGLGLVFPIFRSASIHGPTLVKQLNVMLIVSLSALFLQVVSFRLFGYVLDYNAWLGIDARIWNEQLNFFRGAGLYQEPSNYCMVTTMLLSVRMLCMTRRVDWLFIISVLSMVVSNSLWGLGASILLVILAAQDIRVTVGLGLLGAVGLALVLYGGGGIFSSIRDTLFDPVTLSRLENINDDASLSIRYGVSSEASPIILMLFGNGLSTRDFQDFGGANGLSFYIYSFGFVGFAILAAWMYFEGRASGNLVTKALIIGMLLAAFPLVTYMQWWAWLALLLRARPTDQHQPAGGKLSPAAMAQWARLKLWTASPPGGRRA